MTLWALGGFRVCGAFTSDSRFIARPEALLGTISGKMIDASPLLIVVTSASFGHC